MLNKLLCRFAIFSILCLVAVAACRPQPTVESELNGPTTVTEGTVQAKKTVVVTALKTVQVVVTSTPTPVPDGGFITYAVFGDAKTMNPIFADDPSSRALVELMFEGLLAVDPFSGAIRPHLAQGWTVSADGLTYTFAIRRGLTWSDGAALTAYDLYFTCQALLSNKLDSPFNKQVAGIASVEVVDDYTVVVTFKEANCANLEALTLPWLPAHVFVGDDLRQVAQFDFAQLADHEFNSWPTVVNGPFMFKEWKRGRQIVLVRNELYWRGRPHLDGIVVQVLEGETALVEQLVARQVDIGINIKPHHLSTLEAEPSLNLFKFLSDGYDLIGLQLGNPADPQPRLNADGTPNPKHGQHPILGDVRVRQAIAYALDRNAIIDAAYAGQAVPLNANVLPTVSWAYNTDLVTRERDLQRAKALLEEAGWQVGASGIRVKGGRALKLKLYTNSGNTVRETIAVQVKKQLREVGIEVEVELLPWEYFLDVLLGQTFDLVVVGWSNMGSNPDDARLWRAQDDLPGRGLNFCSYAGTEVEAALNQARTLPGCDLDKRAALYKQVQAQLYADLPYIWIAVPRNIVAVNNRIGGVNPGPWGVWHNVHEWFVQP